MILSLSSFGKDSKIVCSAELTMFGPDGFNFISKSDISKTVQVTSLAGTREIDSINMIETIEFDGDYSLELKLNEIIDVYTGEVTLRIDGKLFRHRVGNGKIVLGANTHSSSFYRNTLGGNINLRVSNASELVNDYPFILENTSVVKDAFIECSTL